MAFTPQIALDRLLEAHAAGRLAHAYLLCGPRGSGKETVLTGLAARILGVGSDELTRHPDFHVAGPESKSRRILVEQIRRLEHALRSKPAAGSKKVALIREADRLQPEAANAFLKTLEEPPAGSHVLLTTSSPDALLQTIRSRCLVVALRPGPPPPPDAVAGALLDALEKALSLQTSPTTAAFSLARAFLDLLGRERDRVREEGMETLKAEQAHYKQATDGSWLEEREEQLKALSEAAALRCRADLIQILANWFADVLRVQNGASPVLDRPAIRQSAASTSPAVALRRVAALEETTSNLDRGVQEALAVEFGFLKLFSISQ